MAAAKFSKKEYLSVKDLEKVLDSCKLDLHQIDEVWPNIYIGNVAIAQNRTALQRLGITHILNAAHSKRGSIGDQSFYGTKFVYFGIPADDSTHFDLDIYFRPAADFIHKALKTPDGEQQRGGRGVMPRGRSCLSCADMEEGRYETPPASELQRLLWVRSGPSGHLDEVRPGIYIGDMYAAKDKRTLQALNITHVLNAAHGKFNVNTGPSYYRDTNIIYHGVEAFDMSSFDMSPFFYSAAKFIKSAMSTPGGKVFVHCAMGLSRSSTLVLAYLMIHEDMTLPEAIKAVAQNRNICPNPGFLEQLRQLDQQLHYQGRVGTAVRL